MTALNLSLRANLTIWRFSPLKARLDNKPIAHCHLSRLVLLGILDIPCGVHLASNDGRDSKRSDAGPRVPRRRRSVDDFDIAQSKIGESAQRVVDRAIEESRRRDHALLTNEHIFLAFAQVEWDTFSQVMRDLELNPHEILQALEEHLQVLPTFSGRELRVAPATKLVFKLAFHQASRAGRQTIESSDLFSAIFEESQGVPVSIIRRHGVEPEVLVTRIATRMRDNELREERLRKRFELPPFLKHFATNLNLLARQDKIAPVYGRDEEIQQVLEILCHRERSNSVMLIGEPGVGKTAIVEGLARRIEFEPDSVPVRLRDCQVINLQMNTMVAGTMLRGMFEDRIQNVIREIKERPNLILFVDEAHTMVGAGSALGAPSDAANVFKSVLARGEVRMIGATTLSEYKEYIQEDEALARRFRTVQVAEPTIEETRRILYNLRPASRAQLLGAAARRGDRNGARDVAALPAASAPARQGDRLARHGGRARRDRPPLGSEGPGRHRGDLARVADPQGHGLPRRGRPVQGRRAPARPARDRPEEGRPGAGAPAGAEQGAAEGRLRPSGRRAAVPRPDRRRQDGAGEVDRRVPVRRRQEDDPHRHVRIPGRRRVGGQADRHAARHRRQRARRIADQPAEGQPVLGGAAGRDREGESQPAELVSAGVRRGLADRRPRQARVPVGRDRDHDVERRIGALPQADQPDGVPLRPAAARPGAVGDQPRARAAVPARVPQPYRSGRPLPAADQGRSARDRARSTSTRWRPR